MSRSVQVRRKTTVEGLDVSRPDGQPVNFMLPHGVSVVLTDLEDPKRPWMPIRNVTASAAVEVTSEQFAQLQEHARVLASGTPDQKAHTLVAPWDQVVSALSPTVERLRIATHSVVKMLRWRFDSPGPPPKEDPPRFKLDGSSWVVAWYESDGKPMGLSPDLAQPTVEQTNGLEEIEEIEGQPTPGLAVPFAEIEADLHNGVEVPLAWDLYYEALNISKTALRPAFLVAFSAAEIGIKQLGGRRSASERWLLDAIQAPPMDQLLSHYLPKFVELRDNERASTEIECVPKAIRRVLQEAMAKRNKVIHSPLGFEPQYAPTRKDVTRLMSAVRDLLHLLDWFGGHPWAFDYLSDETRAAYPPGVAPLLIPRSV
jgi:hypothetical protein